jgi:hypothetical protein
MEAGLKPTVTPAGSPLADRLTAALNPFNTVVVTVAVFEPPCAALTDVGKADMVKSGVTETVRFTMVVCVTFPPIPVMVTGYVPGATDDATVKVAVELPLPGAAIEAGLKPTVTPVGAPLADNAIAELNPFSPAVVIVEVPVDPCAAVAAVPEIVKSAAAVTVRFTNVLCTVPPDVPVMVTG